MKKIILILMLSVLAVGFPLSILGCSGGHGGGYSSSPGLFLRAALSATSPVSPASAASAVLPVSAASPVSPVVPADTAVDLNDGVLHANAVVYCNNNLLAIADDQAVKIKNTQTGVTEVIVSYGINANQIGLCEDIAFDINTVDFEVLYIKERATGNIYKYVLAAKSFSFYGTALPAGVSFSAETTDKYNGVKYSVTDSQIQSAADASVWTPKGKTNNEEDYLGTTPLSSSTNLYYKTKTDMIFYQYPDEINPLQIIKADTNVILLNSTPHFYTDPGKTSAADPDNIGDWYFVLFEQGTRQSTGYIKKAGLEQSTAYRETNLSALDKRIIDFAPQTGNYVGRVIRNNVNVYKYPTGIYPLYVGSVPKTKQTGDTATNSLPIKAIITIHDYVNAWYFFEVDIAGGVGFVPTNYVIDINKESEKERIVDNASITAETDKTVPVFYKDAYGRMAPADVDGLKDGMRIRTIDFDRNSQWTRIRYFDPDIGEWYQLDGYIETKYIAPDSWTASQWTGFFLISAVTVGLVILVIAGAVKKKKKPLPAAGG
jgi:hypothetical protein